MAKLIPPRGPQRVLAVANFVNTVGNGVYFTAGTLYFTRILHLSAGQVGAGLSVAGLVALASGIPIGHIADRLGSRGVYAATLLGGAVAMVVFCMRRDLMAFVLAATVAAVSQTAGAAARAPMIRRFGGDRPQEFRAYLRSVTNIGISIGALAAGLAIQMDTAPAYLVLMAINALSFVGSAALILTIPPVTPEHAADRSPWRALTDLPYVALTALDGLLAVQYKVLTIAVPLWIAAYTSAPRWLVAVTFLVNTIIVSTLQVRASRGIDSPQAGGRALRRAGFMFLAACVLIALSADESTWLASVLIVTAIIVHTIGELWQASGGFEVSFQLAPSTHTGQYLGLFGMGLGLADTIGPALLTTLCIGYGSRGWLLLGLGFALVGMAVPAAVGLAARTRRATASASLDPTP
jgi:hypothetical protein